MRFDRAPGSPNQDGIQGRLFHRPGPTGRVAGAAYEKREVNMRKLIAITQLSLDGVMQAPGGPDEDRQSGFAHGGWAMLSEDDAVQKAMEKLMAGKFELLLGRRTYDIFAGYWPQHGDNFIGKAFNKTVKYVATRKRD